MSPDRIRGLRRAVAVATTGAVVSCGGGDTVTTSVSLSSLPSVTGSLLGLPASTAASEPANNAIVSVEDTSNGETPIPLASVALNGTPLQYNSVRGRYEGHVAVNPGAPVSLTVQIGSQSYTANATQFSVYPVLTAPQPEQTIGSSQTLSVLWHGSTPAPPDGYQLSVLDASQPDGDPVWSSSSGGSLLPSTATSYDIPGSTIPAGQRLVLLGAVQNIAVTGAAPGSIFQLGAYDIVPVGVSGLPVTHRVSGTLERLNGVAGSGTQFVAVGDAGTIITSADGSSWAAQVSATSQVLYGVAWSRSQWVTVGDGGTILTSPDGILWTKRASGTNTLFYSVADSGTRYVAVGFFGSIYTSLDGSRWSARVSGTQDVLQGVACSPIRCVAVGRAGNILSSEDGVSWTLRVFQSAAQNSGYQGVIWAGTQFLATGYGYTPCCPATFATSPDGLSWTVTTSNAVVGPNAVAYSGSNFLAVGGTTMLSSPDAVTWTPIATGSPFDLLGVTFAGSEFVAVGLEGTIYTSP